MKLDVLKIANTGRTALFVASNNQNKGQVNEEEAGGMHNHHRFYARECLKKRYSVYLYYSTYY